jgi:hypothetical protein
MPGNMGSPAGTYKLVRSEALASRVLILKARSKRDASACETRVGPSQKRQ